MGGYETDSVHVDADGSSGGLITVWKSDFFKLEFSCCSRRFILISGILLPNFQGTILNVNGPIWEDVWLGNLPGRGLSMDDIRFKLSSVVSAE